MTSIWFASFFLFSSRRRHTRWPRDWSSDVCSSDLPGLNLDGYLKKLFGCIRRVEPSACDKAYPPLGNAQERGVKPLGHRVLVVRVHLGLYRIVAQESTKRCLRRWALDGRH